MPLQLKLTRKITLLYNSLNLQVLAHSCSCMLESLCLSIHLCNLRNYRRDFYDLVLSVHNKLCYTKLLVILVLSAKKHIIISSKTGFIVTKLLHKMRYRTQRILQMLFETLCPWFIVNKTTGNITYGNAK